ncbi:hypothetical protein [Aquipuribacter nitratireducens]|uniref:Uncharacterized protein n=1 Tax=Aquipuribacter nitratireducens TaxID=650104 RepID=A0ABW0GQT9_9MICO
MTDTDDSTTGSASSRTGIVLLSVGAVGGLAAVALGAGTWERTASPPRMTASPPAAAVEEPVGPQARDNRSEASNPVPSEAVVVDPRSEPSAASKSLAGYPFSADSLWREDVSDAPLHERSEALRDHLLASFADRYGGVASLNVWDYNNSYYVAEPGTPTTDVAFDDCQDKGYLPDGWDDQFAEVPIPEGAEPAEGRDRALSVYSPTTDQLWEFWRADEREGGWYACWGGRLDEVSESEGIFEDGWGSTATGLSHTAGMVRIADVRAGRIEHAVALAIPEPATWKEYSWPAQRSDGWSDDPDAVPEGTRLRLDDDVDVEALDLHPVAEMIARAGQEYGFVVTDRADTLAVTTESGVPEQQATGQNPWEELLDGTPTYEVLADFPWDALEVLPEDYGRPDVAD